MSKIKKTEIQKNILTLLKKKSIIDIRSVAEVSGLSKDDEVDRKAIQRALNGLIEQGLLKPEGAARSRVYVRLDSAIELVGYKAEVFDDIPLSKEAQKILTLVSKPLRSRTSVGYDSNFLKNYIPNKTFYLSQQQRTELLSNGRVEEKVRPAGTYARQILSRVVIDLSWNSSRLEGNTYSLLETKNLIELGKVVDGKDSVETQMILNHKSAIEYIIESASEDKLTSHDIRSVHALLSENLLGDSRASGQIRKISVGIGGSTYIPTENVHVLNDNFELFIKKFNAIKNPFEQSFFSLVHLSYLQAFEDINKRTARIVSNIPLVKKNLKPLAFTDVLQEAYVKGLLGVYELKDVSLLRDLYIWAYRRSALRYSAVQRATEEPNLLKLNYRDFIHEAVRTVILERLSSAIVTSRLKKMIASREIKKPDASALFEIIETEILNLHEGNIARYKLKPSDFVLWKKMK